MFVEWYNLKFLTYVPMSKSKTEELKIASKDANSLQLHLT